MIGVFDSGFGGLTVLKSFAKKLPDRSFIYLGDNARAPYGGRSQEIIYQYAREAVDFLFARGCRLVIFACNTASSQALRRIQQEYLPPNYPGRNVLGVIRPLVEAAAADHSVKRVGVLATRATVESRAYEIELKKMNPALAVFQNSAPLLVPLIEEGWQGKPETRMILKKYLRPLKEKQIDALILGCTHYPLLYREIIRIMPARCKAYEPGAIIADRLADYLSRHPEYDDNESVSPFCEFHTTDDPARFAGLAYKFLGRSDIKISKAELR